MKPLKTLAAAGTFAVAVGAATAASATCEFDRNGNVTGLFQSDSFRALERNAMNHNGLAVVISQRRGDLVYHLNTQSKYTGQEAADYCARARGARRDPNTGTQLSVTRLTR